MTSDITSDLLERVLDEREAQLYEFGDQHHRPFYSESALRDFARQADHWKQINAARVESDDLAWDGILLEEVYEALSETEPRLRVAELIQVAAVALAEAESLERLIAETEEAA